MARLEVSREQILAYRRRVGGLDERLPRGKRSLRRAAWAGLQDSMPRAALLSIHARVDATTPETWDDESLVQLWGPRFSTYVVAARDLAVFSLGRLPDDPDKRRMAEEVAARVRQLLDGEKMLDRDIGRALGMNTNGLRYAAPTGTVVIRWDGARAPLVWAVPPPEMDPRDARLELARRHLHVFGPTRADAFAAWAGIPRSAGVAAFERLRRSLTPVATPIGDAWILTRDEPDLRADPGPPAPARLLPSGDSYWLLKGDDRELLVPDADHRALLWTPRVWPGAVMVDGEVVGTWRRAQEKVSIDAWRNLSRRELQTVEEEAASVPVPGVDGQIVVRWED